MPSVGAVERDLDVYIHARDLGACSRGRGRGHLAQGANELGGALAGARAEQLDVGRGRRVARREHRLFPVG